MWRQGGHMAMRWHLKELIGRAESVTGEGLPYRTIGADTGINTDAEIIHDNIIFNHIIRHALDPFASVIHNNIACNISRR